MFNSQWSWIPEHNAICDHKTRLPAKAPEHSSCQEEHCHWQRQLLANCAIMTYGHRSSRLVLLLQDSTAVVPWQQESVDLQCCDTCEKSMLSWSESLQDPWSHVHQHICTGALTSICHPTCLPSQLSHSPFISTLTLPYSTDRTLCQLTPRLFKDTQDRPHFLRQDGIKLCRRLQAGQQFAVPVISKR